jgi:hypothetical protein
MGLAYRKQKWQDWFTQQWAILWGKKVNPGDTPWLIGPFGELNGIGEHVIEQLAHKENLIIERNAKSGLIASINQLNLPAKELSGLSQQVVDFYENTAEYELQMSVKWNSFFKPLGLLVNKLFSNRINQLNIPTENIDDNELMMSEIISLRHRGTQETVYTIWLRTIKSTGRVIYSGVYGTCVLPSGLSCIKAVFPLPQGNATVIMKPFVGINGELILDGSGRKFGGPGFYFVLKDAKGNYWSQYIASFRDELIIGTNNNGGLAAKQTLSLWGKKVLQLSYTITRKE